MPAMMNEAFCLPDSHAFSSSSDTPVKPFYYDTTEDLDHLFRVCTTLNDPVAPPPSSWPDPISPLQEDADEDEIEYTFAQLEDLPHQARREPVGPLTTMASHNWPAQLGESHFGALHGYTAQQSSQGDGAADDSGSDDEDDDDDSTPFDLPELDYVDSAPGTPLPDRELDIDLRLPASEASSHFNNDYAATPRARAADPLANGVDWSAFGFDLGGNGIGSGSGDAFDWSLYQDKAKDAYAESSGFVLPQQGDIADAEWELALSYANGDVIMGDQGYDSANLFGPPPGVAEPCDISASIPDDGWAIASGSGAIDSCMSLPQQTEQNSTLGNMFTGSLFMGDDGSQTILNSVPNSSWPAFNPTEANNTFGCYSDPFESSCPLAAINLLPVVTGPDNEISATAPSWVDDLIRSSAPEPLPSTDPLKLEVKVPDSTDSLSTNTTSPTPSSKDAISTSSEVPLRPSVEQISQVNSVGKPKKSSHHGRSVRTMPASSAPKQKPKSSTSASIAGSTKKRNRAPERPKNLQCSYCPRMFSRPYNLRAHEETHSGLRKHVCPVCLHLYPEDVDVKVKESGVDNIKRYARKHDLARHLDAVHDEFLENMGVKLQEAIQEGWRVPSGV